MEENKENQIPTPPKPPIQAPKNIGMVKTYAEDMAHALDNAQGGVIKNIIKEQDQISQEEENLSPDSKKNRLLMVFSGFSIVTALVLIFVMVTYKQRVATVEVQKQYTPIIYTDKTQFIKIDNMNREQIIDSVVSEANALDIKKTGIESIYLTENDQIVTFKRFNELLKTNIPPEVLGYTNDNFMIGAYNGDKKTIFILLQVKSFTDIFPGFKVWEGTMFGDLHSLFGTDINTETKDLLIKDFTDSVVGNKNARVLYDKDNKAVLGYVFANDSSVVVIGDEGAANEVMLRLSTGVVKK